MDTPTTEQTKRKRGRPPGRRDVYDPSLTIRIPDAMRQGLNALARARNTTVSALVRDYLPGVDWYATPDGQQALRILELSIALSTTVNKGLSEFTGTPTPDHWNGVPVFRFDRVDTNTTNDVELQPVTYADGTVDVEPTDVDPRPLYVHTVVQREYETRDEAIARYAGVVWGALATVWPVEARVRELNDLRDHTQHAFVVAYPGLRHWSTFPDADVLALHERLRPRATGVEPATADEQQVFEHYQPVFEGIAHGWRTAKPTDPKDAERTAVVELSSDDDQPDAYQGIAELALDRRIDAKTANDRLTRELRAHTEQVNDPLPGFNLAFEFVLYPDETPVLASQRWARIMVEQYREFVNDYNANPTLFGQATPGAFVDDRSHATFTIRELRWLSDVQRSTRNR